jgi:preprotein translocase subunit YajC
MPSPALSQSVPVANSTQAMSATSPTPAPQGGYDFLSMGLPLVFMVALYLLVIRPNNKRVSDQKQMVDALKVGDEVVVTGGNMGIITKLEDSHIQLKVHDTIELLFQRQAIQHILPKGTLKLPSSGKSHAPTKSS